MTKYVEIGGARRPVRFGFAALYEYEQKTGRKAIADFAELQSGIEHASISLLVNIIYCGLSAGYKSAGIPQDFDEYDVADWISESMDVVADVMSVFADSFPAGNAKRGKATKTKPTPV